MLGISYVKNVTIFCKRQMLSFHPHTQHNMLSYNIRGDCLIGTILAFFGPMVCDGFS